MTYNESPTLTLQLNLCYLNDDDNKIKFSFREKASQPTKLFLSVLL
jgi:hypothetical protein